MTDYFSEYQAFVGAKGLPTPSDTPYETPGYIRSKRASRTTQASSTRSREASVSPPPLPPDTTELNDQPRDGRYNGVDPRRFTPTLHASLVSEILNLRRELDSKNSLVENLETNLSSARNDCDALNDELGIRSKEARLAKQRAEQLEEGTDEIVTVLTQERDAANGTLEDLRGKLDAAQKKLRRQDEDVLRTQVICEQDKESWESERRQLERRVHVTESRLRSFVDEMTSQRALTEQELEQKNAGDDGETFKDSGVGAESDTASVNSTPTGRKHRRNMSSLSYRTRSVRSSFSPRKVVETPDLHTRPNGYSLADELGIDEEVESVLDDFDQLDDETSRPSTGKRSTRSWSNHSQSRPGVIAKRGSKIIGEILNSPSLNGHTSSISQEAAPTPTLPETAICATKVQYVDTGYQPSPPQSPDREGCSDPTINVPEIREPCTVEANSNGAMRGTARQDHALNVTTSLLNSPISPPQTPVFDQMPFKSDERSAYVSSSTQTEGAVPEAARPLEANKRDSLSPPSFVPSISIHPPSSRPSSPRTYVLPPGTRDASTQACLAWISTDASTQTEGIRVDKREFPKPQTGKASEGSQLLPSPELEDPPEVPKQRVASGGTAKIFRNVDRAQGSSGPASRSPPKRSLTRTSPTRKSPPKARASAPKDLKLPLRPLPLPRPVLSPPADERSPGEIYTQQQQESDGPLNRSSQYGVTKPLQASSHLAGLADESDDSDLDDMLSDGESRDLATSIPTTNRPHGRFGLSEPPKAVPEDKEISPERRPETSGSAAAAPAPSISSSRATSHRTRGKPPAKLSSYHSRNPSVGSVTSSSYSTQSAMPPFPIPARSSSRMTPQAHSEGSASPTPYSDTFSQRRTRGSRTTPISQPNLRKVQSAAVVRPRSNRSSPQKYRRRRRSPDLTPVQSMAFESPQTNFPIPELPTPLQQQGQSGNGLDGANGFDRPPATADSTLSNAHQENGLVDAIAATMVGEWMYKYVRKRKSFGVGENQSLKPDEDGTVDITGNGVRHRRWVWLSPYERTIMWDNKQPANGIALLGKKGRKLAIQSVMDVKDDTPMPKDAKVEVPFNRSILVLTPQRALKFTAPSAERHALWMTALSFLADGDARPLTPANHLAPSKPSLEPEMPTPPPIRMPQHEPQGPNKAGAPRFGRAKLRDSVRLANGRRPSFHKSMSDQPPPARHQTRITDEQPMDPADDPNDDENDGAAFPAIPRLYSNTARHSHQRKRSNTSPRLPQPLISNLRSFSSSAAIPSSNPNHNHNNNSSNPRPNIHTHKPPSSYPPRPPPTEDPTPYNFFEAVGTVRMQAFVDPSVRDGVLYVPAPPLVSQDQSQHHHQQQHHSTNGPGPPPFGAEKGPIGSRRLRGDSGVSSSTASLLDKRRAGYVFDDEGRDPFKGF
ncbi:hypothetical protein MBLNU230_g7121t1 [Neophaeotheca triangularis]